MDEGVFGGHPIVRESSDVRRSDTALALVVCLATIYLVTVSLPPLASGVWAPGEDEGFLLYVTWRVSLGELPYRDVFDNQFPNLYLAAAPLVRTVGPRVDAPRFFVLAFFVLLAAGFFLLSWRWRGTLSAGAIAAGLLMLTPAFRDVLTRFRPDVPALAAGLLALVGLFWSRKGSGFGAGMRCLAVGSGLLFGLACFLKPTPVYWIPGLVLGLWLTRRSDAGRSGGFLFGGAALVGLLLQATFWQMATDGEIWRQVVSANRVPVPGSSPFWVVGEWTLQNLWLFPGLGLWAFTDTRGSVSRTLILAGAGGLVTYLVAHPNTPYPRHLLFVSVAWAYPAAVGYEQGWRRGVRTPWRKGRWLSCLLAGIVVIVAVAGVESAGSDERVVLREADWIRTHTEPGDVVLTDYAGLNYLAERPRPPALANVSANLTMGGVLTADDVRRAVAQSGPALIYLHVYPDAWHLANVRGMDAVVAAWVENFHYRGLRIAGGRMNMVFTANGGALPGLDQGPRESLAALEPVFSTYEWDRTLRALRERVSS